MDPYRHLPHFRDKIVDPAQSELRVTPERLREWDRQAREQGTPADWRLSDEEREAGRRATLNDWNSADDLWVFGFGSLMWDPGIHFEEIRLARAAGHKRSFCIETDLARGNPEAPALFLALDEGGQCDGLALRITARRLEEETTHLWRREMVAGSYAPSFIELETPQGPLRAIAFVANRESTQYTPGLAPERQAAMIAAAAGQLGSNADYLFDTALHLRILNLGDDYIFDLEARVRALKG